MRERERQMGYSPYEDEIDRISMACFHPVLSLGDISRPPHRASCTKKQEINFGSEG